MEPSGIGLREEFDRLSDFTDERWNHNSHYHAWLLDRLPSRIGTALDIGCGTGTFSRALALRAERVLAVDLSAGMLRIAREGSAGFDNIQYRVADFLATHEGQGSFDCVASIAALHHMPFETALRAMKRALAPGGTLLVLDLFEPRSPIDFAVRGLALSVSRALRRMRCGSWRNDAATRKAWDEHARLDSFLTLAEVRAACARELPGARVRRHLLWRYSIVWKKPEQPLPC